MEQNDKSLLMEYGELDAYSGLLRQAVAVIENARTEIAKHINGYVSIAYWEIGRCFMNAR